MEVFFKTLLIVFCILILFSLRAYSDVTHSRENDSCQQDPQKAFIAKDAFILLMNVNPNVSSEEMVSIHEDLNDFIKKLRRKQERYRSEERLVRFIFYKIHNRYLKHYKQHTDFYEMMDKGYYDCITGTAFYALVLDALGIQYYIHELPYHVYMTVMVDDSQQKVLLESTDGMAGFVDEPKEIASRIDAYQQGGEQDATDYYQYNFEINETISLHQLAGLNYYNEAVIYYNQQQLDQARNYLKKARALYPAARMEALQSLIDRVERQQLATTDR